MQPTPISIDSKLSGKYQIVIPRNIRKALGVEKGDKIFWNLKKIDERIIAELYPMPKSWTEYMRGLGKKIWQKVDADKYLQELRNEWEKKT